MAIFFLLPRDFRAIRTPYHHARISMKSGHFEQRFCVTAGAHLLKSKMMRGCEKNRVEIGTRIASKIAVVNGLRLCK